MKHIALFLSPLKKRKNILFLLAVLLFFVPLLKAQNANQPVYIVLNYMKTNPGKAEAYDNLVKNYAKKAFQQSLKDGQILGWYLNEVVMPSGTSNEYDRVSVTVTRDLKSIFEPSVSMRDVAKKALNMNDQQVDDILKQFADARNIVKREIFVNNAILNPGGTNGKYAVVDFMKSTPGKEAQYVKMEKDVFMPIHKERMKLGVIKNWGLYQKVMPYNMDSDYDYTTVNFIDDINSILDPKYEQALKKALPNQDINKLIQQTEAARKMKRSEIWRLNEFVDSSNTK